MPTQSSYPDHLILDLQLHRQAVGPLIRRLDEIMGQQKAPFLQWQEPVVTGPLDPSLQCLLERAASLDRRPIPTAIVLFFEKRSEFFLPIDPDSDIWRCRLTVDVTECSPAEICSGLRLCVGLVANLVQFTAIEEAALDRVGGGLEGMPYVPLIGTSHLALVSREQVAECYERPEVFWEGPWESSEVYGQQFLVTRGLDMADTAALYASVLEQQLALARAAVADETDYHSPTLLSEEEDTFYAGEGILNPVGYLPESRTVEYSCSASPGTHIRVWEIYTLARMVWEKQIEGGEPVETVRVVFLWVETAQQEKRPLLDIGVQVHHYNEQGELVQLSQ